MRASNNGEHQNGFTRRRLLGGTGALAIGATAAQDPLSSLGDTKSPDLNVIAIGHEYRQDDMPSIAAAPDGSFWVTWLSFDGTRDDIAIRHFRDGTWQDLQWVPGTTGDSWLPQVAVDKSNCVWVIWSQNTDSGWGIYARRFDPFRQQWGKLQKFTSGPLPNINLRVWSDGTGRAALVWQGFRKNSDWKEAKSNIFLRILEDSEWSPEIRVTNQQANDWDPAVAIDGRANVWIAYDSYRNGNYDVYLAHAQKEQVLNPEIAVAVTPSFEARSTVAVDSLDRVWVAWETGLPNWGKASGKILGKRALGVPLGGAREPQIACYKDGRWFVPEVPLASAYPNANTYQPHVFSDGRGSVWVVAMMRKLGPLPRSGPPHKLAYWEYWAQAPFGYWEYWATHLDGSHWSEPFPLPNSKGRSSTRMAAALGKEGKLWLAWPTDNRRDVYYHRPVRQQVYAGTIPPSRGVALSLKDRPSVASRNAHSNVEVDAVRRLREYSTFIDGKSQRLLRGDLHRHTELSWDEGGARDGSLQDFYRYMLDAGALDFGANTDHQGGAWPYWWWYSQKMTDMYHVPGTYVSLFSHERSASYPHGHRNVFFAKRSEARVIPFYMQEGASLYALPRTSEGDEPADETPQIAENDTALLYEELRSRHGIAIPHTTGSGMGTNWHYHDERIEPVVEIFQGCRQSYEAIGAPYAVTAAEVAKDSTAPQATENTIENMLLAMFRIRPDGMVTKAWEKGHKLGVIASSDHISTHLSFAMIYTDNPTREGILDALRRRHTYGATDNILLDVRMGDHFMGDAFPSSEAGVIQIKAHGTNTISKLDVIKDGKTIHSFYPNRNAVDLELSDPTADTLRHFYYVRLIQSDGMIAWSSPFFVNYSSDELA